MLLIDNERVSDCNWGEDAEDALREALADADAGAVAEAFIYRSPTGEPVGGHHEVRDGVMIVNRRGVWMAMGEFDGPFSVGEEPRVPLAARVEARTHLRRHLRACEAIDVGE